MLRYTTDGAEPTASSAVFPSSLQVSNTTLFRVAAFKTNYLRQKRHPFLLLQFAGERPFLPVISIVTSTNHLFSTNGILGIRGGTYASGPWQALTATDFHNPPSTALLGNA